MKIYFVFLIFVNLFFFIFHDRISNFINVFDKPDKLRKFHKDNIAITGGILVFFNLAIYSIYNFINPDNFINEYYFYNNIDFFIFLGTCFSLFSLGIIDDKYNISPNKKLLLIILILLPGIFYSDQLVIENIKLTFLENQYSLNLFSKFWTLLCFLLFLNAFNMFDGINLQVVLYSLFICLVLIFFTGFEILFVSLIISLLFFMILNLKSKSFFGDGGTYLLSYIFAYLFIKLYNQTNEIYADQIVLLMLLPGLELMRLFIVRLTSKRNPFSGDRNHLHHLLLKENNFLRVTLITQSLIILPFLFSLLIGFTIGFIFLVLILYSIIIFKYTR